MHYTTTHLTSFYQNGEKSGQAIACLPDGSYGPHSPCSPRADLDISVWGGVAQWQIQKNTKIRTPLGGVWGHAPPEKFCHIHALRQLLVRYEANILPQIVPEILGNKLNLNGIWCLLPLKFLELNLHAILKLTLKSAVLKIRILADFAGLVSRNSHRYP